MAGVYIHEGLFDDELGPRVSIRARMLLIELAMSASRLRSTSIPVAEVDQKLAWADTGGVALDELVEAGLVLRLPSGVLLTPHSGSWVQPDLSADDAEED